MKLNKLGLYRPFWFGLLLGMSIMLVPIVFAYADTVRGYNALGGEVFIIALPLSVIAWRAWSVDQLKKLRKYRAQELQKAKIYVAKKIAQMNGNTPNQK